MWIHENKDIKYFTIYLTIKYHNRLEINDVFVHLKNIIYFLFQFHLVTLTVIMNDIYISVECIMCPNCFHVFDNSLIVNCEINCVICEKCVNKLANIKKMNKLLKVV